MVLQHSISISCCLGTYMLDFRLKALTVTEIVHPGAMCTQLPHRYYTTRDVCSVGGPCPLFCSAERTLETEHP